MARIAGVGLWEHTERGPTMPPATQVAGHGCLCGGEVGSDQRGGEHHRFAPLLTDGKKTPGPFAGRAVQDNNAQGFSGHRVKRALRPRRMCRRPPLGRARDVIKAGRLVLAVAEGQRVRPRLDVDEGRRRCRHLCSRPPHGIAGDGLHALVSQSLQGLK